MKIKKRIDGVECKIHLPLPASRRQRLPCMHGLKRAEEAEFETQGRICGLLPSAF
jgi:hypothetical protein